MVQSKEEYSVSLEASGVGWILHSDHSLMAFSFLSPSTSPHAFFGSSSSSSTYSTANNIKLFAKRRRALTFVAKASGNDDDEPAFNPFGFVTDNPSSRNAIQLPESPAEDGNVGQMLYVMQTRSFFNLSRTYSSIYRS